VFLTELVDDARQNHDTAGSNQGYQALNSAVGEVDAADFRPDTYVTHPDYRTALFNDTNLSYSNRAGTNEVLRNREDAPIVGDIAGLDMHAAMSSATYDDGTDTGWSGGSSTRLWGCRVRPRQHPHHPVLPERAGRGSQGLRGHITGVNARINVDCQFSQGRSAATIEY